MVEEKTTKKEEKISYEIGTVVTQTAPAIINTKSGQAVSYDEVLILILNKLDKIERSLG